MTPSDVEQIVPDTEQDDALQREDGPEERRELVVRKSVKETSCLDLL